MKAGYLAAADQGPLGLCFRKQNHPLGSLSLIVLDQITKIWVVENICYRGDDLCQEADGFRVIDHASSSGVDGEIGDIRLDVEDTVVTAMWKLWDGLAFRGFL